MNYLGQAQAYETNGYVATIADVRLLSAFTGVGLTEPEVESVNSTTVSSNVSKTVIGTTINLTATAANTVFVGDDTEVLTTLTVVGRDSGARLTIPVKIVKV